MAQSGPGKIRLFEDFFGDEDRVTGTHTIYKRNVGSLRVFGLGTITNDSGVPMDETVCPLSGVAVLTTSADASDCCGLTTTKMFDVELMAPLVMETRVQFADLETKSIFIGFSDENDEGETAILETSGTTISPSASDYVGFHWDHSMTGVSEDEWHAVYRGGTTTAGTDSADVDLDETIVEDEWDILRVEVDNNGTARWYVNGKLKKTLAGAVSTTTNLAAQILLQADGDNVEVAYVDYILIEANRDWTR